MQRLGASLVFALCLTYSGTAEGAYIIKLANGNEFVTGRYWHEGTRVMFETYGGVIGVDRKFITKIEKSSEALKVQGDRKEDPRDKPQTEHAKEEEPKKPITAADAKPDAERKDDPIVQESNRLKERSKGVDGMLTSEIRELLKDITAFKNKLRRDSKLFIKYSGEFNDAQELGAKTETALRSRDQ